MSEERVVVAIYNTHTDAAAAIREHLSTLADCTPGLPHDGSTSTHGMGMRMVFICDICVGN